MSSAETLADQRLSQNIELGTLCAFYGGLLTQRQRIAIQLHCDEDLSLTEVAEHLGVSRQNVHDLIARSAQKLDRYETAIGAIAQSRQTAVLLKRVLYTLQSAKEIASADPAVAIQQITEAGSLVTKAIAHIIGEE
ncbi:MAG: hypothetical protein FWF86_04800 [Clostridia bacterium]|nr:hypothetical protein [Clostridia bacterium]